MSWGLDMRTWEEVLRVDKGGTNAPVLGTWKKFRCWPSNIRASIHLVDFERYLAMPNPGLDAYLAKHYLDGPKAEAILSREGGPPKKRKKKKEVPSNSGFQIIDDVEKTWRPAEEGEDSDVAIVQDDGEEEKRSKWARLGDKGDEIPRLDDKGEGIPSKPAPIRAGLKTKEEMRAERLERERIERENASASQASDSDVRDKRAKERQEHQQETVYRDASGRKIDVAQEEEEKERERQKQRRREREKKDWNKGQVQLAQQRSAYEREQQALQEGVTRYVLFAVHRHPD